MKPTDFAYRLSEYLGKHLPGRAGLSANTILSYRDTFLLLLRHCRDTIGIAPERITFAHITKELVEGFLDSLAHERGCSAKTVNQRLAAIHAFFRYLQTEAPEELFRCQQILAIGFIKTPRGSFVEHISLDAIQAILAQPDTESLKGRRDLTILALMFSCVFVPVLSVHDRTGTSICPTGKEGGYYPEVYRRTVGSGQINRLTDLYKILRTEQLQAYRRGHTSAYRP